ARLEFRVGGEQRRAAPGAVEHSVVLDVEQLARPRTLGALLTQDVELLGSQLLTPLGVGLINLVTHASPCAWGSESYGSDVAFGSGSPTGLLRPACGSRSGSVTGGRSFASSGRFAASWGSGSRW